MEQYEKIAVMGLGSSGRVAVNDMNERGIECVKLIVVEDGALSLPLETSLAGTDMLFLAAAPGEEGFSQAITYANTARKMGILTFGLALVPQNYDMDGLKSFKDAVDAVMPALNYEESSLVVKFVSDLINKAGFVNLDFVDIRTVLFKAGYVCTGAGAGAGENRAEGAARNALRALSKYTSPENVAKIIMGISSGPDVRLVEIAYASDILTGAVAPDARVVWAQTIDDSAGEKIEVRLLAAAPSSFVPYSQEATTRLLSRLSR